MDKKTRSAISEWVWRVLRSIDREVARAQRKKS
jgi:hypothetical protein